jgi:hypothetical protein
MHALGESEKLDLARRYDALPQRFALLRKLARYVPWAGELDIRQRLSLVLH